MLRHRAEHQPNEGPVYLPAGEGEGRQLTYAELDRRAAQLAWRLSRHTQPGDRALLLHGEGLEVAVAFFAALYAGLVTVPIAPPRPNQPSEELLALATDADITVVLTDARLESMAADLFSDSATTIVVTDGLDSPELAVKAGWEPVATEPGALASLLYTSGSTSRPRGVMLSHSHLMHRLRVTQQVVYPDNRQGLHSLSWMPLHHIWGLTGAVLQPMYSGIPVVVLPTSAVIERPARWLRAISRYQINGSGAPNFAFQACLDAVDDEECVGLDLSSWQLAPLGAETIRADTLDQFTERYAPYGFRRQAFRTAYGMSEGLATMDIRQGSDKPHRFFVDRILLEADLVRPATDPEVGQALVSCGSPMPGQRLIIVDPDRGVDLGEDRVGEIWNSGPLVADGYYKQPEETQRVFGAKLANGEGPFLRTGDLGFLHQGELYVTGRLKDMLIIRGKNLYAVDLEHTAEQAHPTLLPTASAAFSVTVDREEQLVLIHEVRPDSAPDVAAVAAAVRRRIGEVHQLPVYAVVLVESGSLPRTRTGKLQRYKAREAYMASQRQDLTPDSEQGR